MLTVRVENMRSSNGNDVPNQFRIFSSDGVYFQSYQSIIAFKPYGGGKVKIDINKWDYSKTTGKYRDVFLRETKTETQRKIDDGTYELKDLNM